MMCDQQRVAGWLALTLQHYPAPLTAADRVSYCTDDAGNLVVTWRGGPTAHTLERHVIERAHPDMPVISLDPLTPPSPTHSRVQVGTVIVLLRSLEPDPQQTPQPPEREPTPTWGPSPLATVGAAEHVVHWNATPDGDTAAATVIELSAEFGRTDVHWCEQSYLVVHADHTWPDHAETAQQRWQRHRERAPILLTDRFHCTTEADEWMLQTQEHERHTGLLAAATSAREWIMRISTPRVAWRITAHADPKPTPYNCGALLPAAVFDALAEDPFFTPPQHLEIRSFGNIWSTQSWHLNIEPTVPTTQA